MKTSYDVIVIGSGPGGATVAAHAAEAGLHVLLAERGPAISPAGASQDHLHNTMSFRYRNMCHARGSDPRLVQGGRGVEIVEPPDPRYIGSAYAVGGGSLTWGMQAWRFEPDDFEMASKYGVPEGSSLADWPVAYEDLLPFYAQAEHELGVAGPADHGQAVEVHYPMPPFPESDVDRWLRIGASKCGWSTQAVPLAINTLPRDSRRACTRCRQCIGFACPVDAKNGSHNTMVPRALATGLCDLATDTRATKITTDASGSVDGVEFLRRGTGAATRRRHVRAKVVVVAAGAIETARLLLLSHSCHHPDGLGNGSGHVGRHLQTHVYPVAMGILPPDVVPVTEGPGVGIATLTHTHDNPGVIGGALLANDFVKTPLGFWESALPPGTPRWGEANQIEMRRLFGRVVDVRGPVQEIPSPDVRVTLEPRVRDAAGVPSVRLSGQLHSETLRTVGYIEEQAVRWLTKSGAVKVWVGPRSIASYHQAGTARMSARPEDGVTDPSGRVHGHDNLFVADASVHVTNGSSNPALTIFALSMWASRSVVDCVTTAGRRSGGVESGTVTLGNEQLQAGHGASGPLISGEHDD